MAIICTISMKTSKMRGRNNQKVYSKFSIIGKVSRIKMLINPVSICELLWNNEISRFLKK
jgi:hypothetical protein